MKSDTDHIQLLITSIFRKLKQRSVHVLWNTHPEFLSKYFRSDGCFVCFIGKADPDTIRR